MNNHLMLDIESAGTGPHAYVLTVGLLEFDPYGNGSEDIGYHLYIPPSLNKGRELNFDTVKWWMQQSMEAQADAWVCPTTYREEFVPEAGERRDEFPVANAQHIIRTCLNNAEHLWANDPDFDCTIMRDWKETNNFDFRWPYGKHRSMRTLKAMYDIPEIMNTLAHNALADCRYQAEQVRAVYQGKAQPKFLNK